MTRENEGTDFWSRRKAAVREAEAREEAERAAREDADKAAELDEKTDPEILEELGLPDPDTLDEGADFRPFLKAVVPERLRRRALRRLWLVNPTLANLDGLVDYGDDFTDAATVVEGLQTAYQVGKGMLKHVERLAEEAEQAEKAEMAADNEGQPEEADAPSEEIASDERPHSKEPSYPEGTGGKPLTETGEWVHSDSWENLSDGVDPDVVEDGGAESAALDALVDEEVASPPRKRMRFSYS